MLSDMTITPHMFYFLTDLEQEIYANLTKNIWLKARHAHIMPE